MWFDKKLTWARNLSEMKAKAQRSLNVIKILSHSTYSSDRNLPLRLLNSLVLPILDYGCCIYDSASETCKKQLNSVLNEGLRLVTGAFRMTPTESLIADTGFLSLELRREKSLKN